MIKFRTATILDADAISKLVNSAYRGDSSRQGWTTEANLLGGQRTDPASLREIMSTNQEQIELAYDSTYPDQILGSVHLRLETVDQLYFGMLTVSPKLQGQGLGKKILDHIESKAKEFQKNKIRITVIHLRSELISYYRRRGFVETGRWEKFPEDDPAFGIPKVKGLKLLEFVKEIK